MSDRIAIYRWCWVLSLVACSGGDRAEDDSSTANATSVGPTTNVITEGGTMEEPTAGMDPTTDSPTAGSTGDDGGDPCAGVDCSGHGTCVVIADAATCDCDDGYIADGLTCFACPAASGSFNIDIPMVTISGAKTVNGKPVNEANSGYLALVNRATGDSAGLGALATNPYSVNIVPGTYDLTYELLNFADGIPRNSRAVILEGVQLNANMSLDIDIPMVTIGGSKTVNGKSVNEPNSGYMYLINRETGDSAGLGALATNPFSVNVVPGTYDVIYELLNSADGIPRNSRAVILEGVQLNANMNLDIDVPMVAIGGSKTVNGKPVNAPDSGYLALVNRETGDSAGLGALGTNPYSVNIVPGTYDLTYELLNSADGVPRNARAVILEDVHLNSNMTLDIDIPMVSISGSKTVNGKPVNAPDSGYMSLVNRETGDRAGLGALGTNPYSVNIVPGTYDLTYELLNSADGVPRNSRAVILEGLALNATMSLDIDIPMVTIGGGKTVNGKPVNAPDSGYLALVNRETGDSAGLGALGTNPYSVNIVPGTYDMTYELLNSAPGVPRNSRAVILEDLPLNTNMSLDIDIPMVTIGGGKTVNGKPVNESNSGYLYFLNRETGDSAGLGPLSVNPYSVQLVPGTYRILYELLNFADGIPRNSRAELSCVQIR